MNYFIATIKYKSEGETYGCTKYTYSGGNPKKITFALTRKIEGAYKKALQKINGTLVSVKLEQTTEKVYRENVHLN